MAGRRTESRQPPTVRPGWTCRPRRWTPGASGCGGQAQGISARDLGPASATSVANILSNATNQASLATAGFTDFYFRGPGFGDRNQIRVTTSLAGVTDIDTLVANSNAAIEAAGESPTAAATSFRNAGIRAAVVTDAAGRKSLSFTSASTAFQVAAGDRMANALLGNVKTVSNPAGRGLTNTVTGGSATAVAGTPFGAAGAGTIALHFRGASLPWPAGVSLRVTATTTIEEALADLRTAISSEASLQGTGLTLALAEAGQPLVFSLSRGERFEVRVAGDVQNRLGLGSFRGSTGAGGTSQYASLTGVAGTFAAIPQTLEFSIADGATESIAVTPSTSGMSGATTALNAAFAGNATLAAAGLRATNNGTVITIASTSGSRFRMAALGGTDVFGFNSPGASSTADTAEIEAGNTEVNFFLSTGARQTDLLSFSKIQNGDDDQTITISAAATSGAIQSLVVVLRNDATLARGGLDDVLNFVNLSLQQSNNATLRQIVAVKDKVTAAGAEGIRFASTLDRFEVAISTNKSGAGIGSQGTVVRAATVGTGSTSSIESEAAATRTVTALSDAVFRLGAAQAVIGRGQNQFTFAVDLAQSQFTTLAASESLIRDADLAQETASLTRAQILLEGGIAALAQAYTAPRQVLSLLRDG